MFVKKSPLYFDITYQIKLKELSWIISSPIVAVLMSLYNLNSRLIKSFKVLIFTVTASFSTNFSSLFYLKKIKIWEFCIKLVTLVLKRIFKENMSKYKNEFN